MESDVYFAKRLKSKMAFYEDLCDCDYLPYSEGLGFKAIGWLEPEREFARGEVTIEFFKRLCELLVNPWAYIAFAGVQPCSFCRFSGGGSAYFQGLRVRAAGDGILFIPSSSTIYISPTSIAHYIDAHGYCPPLLFQTAVLDCPDMRSMAYMRALLRTEVKTWMNLLKNRSSDKGG